MGANDCAATRSQVDSQPDADTYDAARRDVDARVEKLSAFVDLAAAIVHAEVFMDPERAQIACLCCGQLARLSVVVIAKPRTIGTTESGGAARQFAGVCAPCRTAASSERRAELTELARAAARVDALLHLIRVRANAPLSSWWGGVGACTPGEVDEASVQLRRALERLGLDARPGASSPS